MFWLCLETAVLRCCGDALELQGKICYVDAKVSVLDVNKLLTSSKRLTSSEDKEASSTGMSSGQRQLLVAQEAHTFLLV